MASDPGPYNRAMPREHEAPRGWTRASRIRGELRPPLSLSELLEILVKQEQITSEHAADIESRTMTLRSLVLKDRVGSVRSQAAARYDVSPAEIVTAANLSHATEPRRKLDEDAIARCLAEVSLFWMV